jgi:hypothetical protein
MSYADLAWEAIISGEGLLLAAWFVFSLVVAMLYGNKNEH